MQTESLQLTAEIESWPLIEPFRITGHIWETLEVLRVQLRSNGHVGQGEAAGVYYKKDTPATMLQEIERKRAQIESGLNRRTLQNLLPPGGARNALDCALWDLESKLTGRPVWQIAELEPPHPILTTLTCGAELPEKMAATAVGYAQARAIKVKLTGEPIDVDRVRAVRAARPDVWLGVDANQGCSRASLESLLPVLVEAQVSLIEQPFPVGQESLLDGLSSPIPVAADESAQTLADIPRLAGRFAIINIKLDKCGGLTEGLAMARAARAAGMDCMVGNMIGTSLAMAPAFLVGQLCKVVDLDGPVFLRKDRPLAVKYSRGEIDCPQGLWG